MNANAHKRNGYSVEAFTGLSAYSDTAREDGSYGE